MAGNEWEQPGLIRVHKFSSHKSKQNLAFYLYYKMSESLITNIYIYIYTHNGAKLSFFHFWKQQVESLFFL